MNSKERNKAEAVGIVTRLALELSTIDAKLGRIDEKLDTMTDPYNDVCCDCDKTIFTCQRWRLEENR